jgi:colanic acid biosynthesis glycosyl transferase WcaI
MRILFVNQYYPPDVSATAYLLGELSEDLARNHEVWVTAGRPSYNPEGGTYQPRGVRLQRVWSTGFDRKRILGRLLNYGTFVLTSLIRTLRLPRPDVVVAMTDPPFIGLIGLLVARYRRVPFVYVCHDIFPEVAIALQRMRNALVILAWRKLNGFVRQGAARVVAIGRDMAVKLEQEGVPPEKIGVLPNWAEDRPPSSRAVKATRKSLGWGDRLVVMHAGNLGLAQDLGVVIQAAARLREHNDILLVFMGDGAARPRLEAQVKRRKLHNVSFLPYVPKDEAQAIIGSADLHLVTLAPGLWGCVVPSKIYGIMAASRPFVAAVEPGSEPALLLEEHGCGLRVDPHDPQALAEAILRMREQPLEEMGRRGRAAFEKHYDRPIATAAYRRLLEEAAQGAGRQQR